ncbi:unnamed protein product, partial [Symbiodinium sp. CCMP2456]
VHLLRCGVRDRVRGGHPHTCLHRARRERETCAGHRRDAGGRGSGLHFSAPGQHFEGGYVQGEAIGFGFQQSGAHDRESGEEGFLCRPAPNPAQVDHHTCPAQAAAGGVEGCHEDHLARSEGLASAV